MKIGVDIVQNNRVNLRVANKIFTSNEMHQFEEINNDDAKTQYIASRFAAKEAIIKATNKKYSFLEIEVLRTNGQPKVNIENIELSISHEKDYSIAFCIYEEKNESRKNNRSNS